MRQGRRMRLKTKPSHVIRDADAEAIKKEAQQVCSAISNELQPMANTMANSTSNLWPTPASEHIVL